MPRNVSVRGAFQLTPSVGRATGNHLICVMLTHISTHALREESDHGIVAACITDDISIHALREEGDNGKKAQIPRYYISIHALREEGDAW